MSNPVPSASSSTLNKIGLKPDEYTKGLSQEHIVRLTEDAYKQFTEYTKAELKRKKKSLHKTKQKNVANVLSFFFIVTVDDCNLLTTMNVVTKEKYTDMSQMSQRLMKEMSKLQNTCA